MFVARQVFFELLGDPAKALELLALHLNALRQCPSFG